MTSDMWFMVLVMFLLTSVSTAIGRRLSRRYRERKSMNKQKTSKINVNTKKRYQNHKRKGGKVK